MHVIRLSLRKRKRSLHTSSPRNQIFVVYKDGGIVKSDVRKWFVRFRNGNVDPEDREFSGMFPEVVN